MIEGLVRAKLIQKHCEGCRLDVGARFRALTGLYLCQECHQAWHVTGKVPGPQIEAVDEAVEVRRW